MLITLCDFNGVLVDDEHVHHRCMAEVMATFGFTVSEDAYFTKYFAFDDAGAFRAMLRDAGHPADDATVATLVQQKRPLYQQAARQDLKLFPGAAALLQRLSAAGRLAIVSGALRDEISFGLERLSAQHLVDFIISAEDCRACKPDPEGYLLALNRMGIAPEHVSSKVVVIEDSPGGVHAGRAAGCRVAAVSHSVPRQALEEAGASLIVDHLDELTIDQLRSLHQ